MFTADVGIWQNHPLEIKLTKNKACNNWLKELLCGQTMAKKCKTNYILKYLYTFSGSPTRTCCKNLIHKTCKRNVNSVLKTLLKTACSGSNKIESEELNQQLQVNLLHFNWARNRFLWHFHWYTSNIINVTTLFPSHIVITSTQNNTGGNNSKK